jgi:hypothetical protein
LALLPGFDIGADGFSGALHRLGGDRQIGQQLHLLASLLERGCMANRGQHASDPGGEFRILDIEFHVRRELAVMALVAQIIRPQTLRFSHRGQHGFGA